MSPRNKGPPSIIRSKDQVLKELNMIRYYYSMIVIISLSGPMLGGNTLLPHPGST